MSYTPPKRRRLTPAQREQIFDLCHGHCAYCGCHITMKDRKCASKKMSILRGDGEAE